MRRSARRAWRRLRRALAAAALAAVVASVAAVATLRWVDPPTTAFMLRAEGPIDHRWVPIDAISPALALAVVAGEDQRFPEHNGFDFGSMADAIGARLEGKRLRGASTISQQVAKNLFLWPGRSYLRKALEAWFTVLIEAFWSKRRILEVYLNVAQFGRNTFGVAAAAEGFFARPAAALDADAAARLAAVLPNPDGYSATAPGPHVTRRAAWIRRQMAQLGGGAYLRGIHPAAGR